MLRITLLVVIVAIIIFMVPRLLAGSHAVIPVAGSAAPGFMLPSQEGTVSLQDYRDRWVVLYFYPKDQTPGCTREAHNFQIDQSKYAERHAVILGVSVDSVDSHKKFCAQRRAELQAPR